MLVIDGAADVMADREGDSQEFVDLLAPRTAACLDTDGMVRFITFDGRTEACGGITLTDLAQWMADQGCGQGVNYDGGGSTTMWIQGQPFGGVTNYPSDDRRPDHEGLRRVSTAWVILAAPYNHPHRFTTKPPTEASDASPYAYDADALDLDMYDQLTFALSDGPDDATIVSQTGELTWQPDWRDAGRVPFVVTVTDETNVTEQAFDVTVSVTDSDGDGLPDGWENEYGTDPNRNDAGEDMDGDGLTNQQEFERGSDPGDPNDPPRAADAGLPDGSVTADASVQTAGTSGGCSCNTGISPSGAIPQVFFFLLLFGWWISRRLRFG